MKNLANKLMLIAAGILMLAGVPSVEITQTDNQTAEVWLSFENELVAGDADAHGSYSTWSVGTVLHVFFVHCGFWQAAALGALVIAALVALGFVAFSSFNPATIYAIFKLGAIAVTAMCEIMWGFCITGELAHTVNDGYELDNVAVT